METNISELPELPEGWCWAALEQITTKVTDGVHKKPEYVDLGVPFITVKESHGWTKNLFRGG